MLIVWWLQDCLIHHSFFKSGRTITAGINACKIDKIHKKPSTYMASFNLQKRPRYLYAITLARTSQKWPWKIKNFALSTLLARHTSTGFFFFRYLSNLLLKKCSKTKMMLKRPSTNSSTPKLLIFMLLELTNWFLNGKSA